MKKRLIILLVITVLATAFSGCASWSEKNHKTDKENENTKITIAATSAAICEILDKLEYDNVVGVPEISGSLPERYNALPTIGTPMNPDMEIIKSIKPDLVLSPQALEASLAEQYTKAGISSAFLDLSSIEGMYTAIDSLGELLGKEQQAAALREEYENYMSEYKKEELENNSCMILMCFPDGFYLIATDNSYVGSLVEMAGGKNVYNDYEGDESGFVSINPEDMVQKNPDKIFVFAHYNEKEAFEYMKNEFETESTWQFYDAVNNGEIYYLSSEMFGMSATFQWKESFCYLKSIFCGEQR